MNYTKTATTFDDQIKKLKSRGLSIDDEPKALNYLETVGYYRLSGYWFPMLADKNKHQFKPNSTFSNIINIYNFDKDLRMLLFDVIESIEIAFRTKLIYHTSLEISPWWFEDAGNFKDPEAHTKTLDAIDRELEQTKENFIRQHYSKYKKDKHRPPAWKTIEITSFGSISMLYGNLKNNINSKKLIAVEFGAVNHSYLPSWLLTITQIRNIIAHHGRLWNKNLPGRPKILSNPPRPWLNNVPPVDEFYKLYIHIAIMKYLLNIINPKNNLTTNIISLLERYNNIDFKALGLKPGWENEPLWKV